MRKPKMILFDAGKTLLDYAEIDALKGIRAIMPYITENPRNLTAEDIESALSRVSESFSACKKDLFEVHEQTILKLVFDLNQLSFSVPLAQIERIIWEETPVIIPVKQAKELLDYLNGKGIRTGVISNIDFSGYLLQERLNQLYPDNQFEFVVASSDYGVRKPSRDLFAVGPAKANLLAEEIWYVGDKVKVDAAGSRACGMVPVLYQAESNSYDEIPPDVIAVTCYDQLICLLESARD